MLRLTRFVLAASVCALALGTSLTAAAQAATDPRLSEAERRFSDAEDLYARGDYTGALAEFQRIYELLEGHERRYFVLYNMGRCQEQLFRYGEALDSYHRYLREGGEGTELAGTVRQKIVELEARLATVTIQTNVPSAEVWIDNRHVGTAPGDVRVDAGQRVIELRARGHAPGRRALQIAARTHQTISIELDRVSAGVSPVFFVTGAALTAVAAGIGIGFGSAALAEQGGINARLASGDESERFQVTQAQIDNVEQLALFADVFFGAALVLGVASVVLVFVTDWAGEAPSAAAVSFAPFATDDAAGLAVQGRF